MAATSKILRNRIVGLLIILSVILILVPAMMSPDEIYKKSPDSIAVNQDGVVEKKQEGMTNYNDLLAPEDDLAKNAPSRQDPAAIAKQNSQTPPADAQIPLPLADHSDLDLPEDVNPFLESPTPKPASPELNADNRKHLASEDAKPKTEPQGEDRMGAFVKQLEQRPASQNSTKPQQQTAKATPAPKPVPAPKAEQNNAKGYVVQVGVFSKAENAQNVIAKLKKGGVTARQESATLNGKSVYRVYAGSTGTRQNAESVAAKVKAITGSEARIVNLNN